MTAEHRTPFDLLKIYQKDLRRDFALIDNMRFDPIMKKKEKVNDLSIIAAPHLIMAADNEFRTGDIIDSSHLIIIAEWKEDARKNGSIFPSTFASATGFCLKFDSSTKYVRLDHSSNDWKEIPEYAETLIKAGYIVVDTQYKRVDKTVDYSLFWTQRNDL